LPLDNFIVALLTEFEIVNRANACSSKAFPEIGTGSSGPCCSSSAALYNPKKRISDPLTETALSVPIVHARTSRITAMERRFRINAMVRGILPKTSGKKQFTIVPSSDEHSLA
jgi:hypothetical protein